MNVDLFGNAIVESEEVSLQTKKVNPFDFINNIAKKSVPESYEEYSPFLTNLSFSQRKDLVLYANEMNKYHGLTNQSQFDFYFHGLPKKNLFSKWAKKDNFDFLEDVKTYYNVGTTVALQYLKVLTVEQKKRISLELENSKGGKKINTP